MLMEINFCWITSSYYYGKCNVLDFFIVVVYNKIQRPTKHCIAEKSKESALQNFTVQYWRNTKKPFLESKFFSVIYFVILIYSKFFKFSKIKISFNNRDSNHSLIDSQRNVLQSRSSQPKHWFYLFSFVGLEPNRSSMHVFFLLPNVFNVLQLILNQHWENQIHFCICFYFWSSTLTTKKKLSNVINTIQKSWRDGGKSILWPGLFHRYK